MSSLPPIKVDSFDQIFIDNCLSVIPNRLHEGLLDRHSQLYPISRQEANLLLLNARIEQERIAEKSTKYITFKPAKKHASICRDLIEESGIFSGADYCESMGIGKPVFPKVEEDPHNKNSQASAIKRMCSQDWWAKRLEKHHARVSELADIDAGKVYRKDQVYVSDRTVNKYADKQTEAQEWIKASVLVSEDLEEVRLSDVVEASVSNPYNRFAEYMVRTKGMEEIADRNPVDETLIKALPNRMTYGKGGLRSDIYLLNDIAKEGDKMVKVAFALTVPSRFHPYKKTDNGFIRNPKYDGSTTKESQAWLQETWGLTTRDWERKENLIDAYGFKVLEVHHAATVHNHLAIYVRAKHVQRLINIFYDKALRGKDGKEAGALRHRLNWKIMTNAGGMVNYMTKYISKGITGADFEDLQAGEASDKTLIRIMAHRSLWGLRQFAFYRSPSVTVWRELRRLRDDFQEDPLIEKARQAAINSDWAAYIDVQGGAFLTMRDRPIKTLMDIKTDDKGNALLNVYGERIERIKGIVHDAVEVVTRVKEWKLINMNAVQALLEGKYKSTGNDAADLGNGLSGVIRKAVDSKQLHKLAEYAGVQMFPPLDLYEITTQRTNGASVF